MKKEIVHIVCMSTYIFLSRVILACKQSKGCMVRMQDQSQYSFVHD